MWKKAGNVIFVREFNPVYLLTIRLLNPNNTFRSFVIVNIFNFKLWKFVSLRDCEALESQLKNSLQELEPLKMVSLKR